MLQALLLSAVAYATPVADTTLQMPSGSHVVIEHRSGDIDVYGVSGREARVTIDGQSRGIEISRSATTFHVSAGRIWDDDEDIVIRLPRDVSIEVHGLDGDVRVFDIEGAVEIGTIEGDIEIENTGRVMAQNADGSVRLSDVRGGATVMTGDGSTWINDVSGDVTVHGIDGDVTVLDANSRTVDLQTIDGDLRYDGTVYAGGEYRLSTHDGTLTFAIPEGAGATLEVSSFDGSLESTFDVEFRGGAVRGAKLNVGDGSARIELQTFDGDIHLIRPGERAPGSS